MRFVLYNIRYATGHSLRWPWSGYLGRSEDHTDVIARFLRDLSPDAVGLVEVDTGSYRMRRNNQSEVIARELGFTHTWRVKYGVDAWPTRIPVLNKQANALLTREPALSEKFHYFERGQKRLVIEVELPDVRLLLVHLALRFRTRQEQLSDLFEVVQNSDRPCIVAGDFNVFLGNREVRLFMGATGLQSANRQHVPTYPSWRPRLELDYVLHSPHLKVSGFSVPQVPLSDHLPIVCDFETVGAPCA
jgi:endonuclease/exonuclease/phosphatase family metal-dependent hydrolase